MNRPNNSFDNQSHARIQRAERRPSPGLVVLHSHGSAVELDDIRDISATGAFVRTNARWPLGRSISLTLQRQGPPEQNPCRRFVLQARTVRWGNDGVGLAFILPPGTEVNLWESGVTAIAGQPEPELVVREFRMARALAFLRRICPAGESTIKHLLRQEWGNFRVASAIQIALHAEEVLTAEGQAGKRFAHRDVVLRILDDGSWVENDSILKLWANLLATSCTANGNDLSTLELVDLLTRLTPPQTRILVAACAGSAKFLSNQGRVSAKPLHCTAPELLRMTGAHDLVRVDRDIEYLAELGLLARRVRSSFFFPTDATNLTPTALGLRLYARCSGHRGDEQSFYGVDLSASSIDMPVVATAADNRVA